MKGVFTMPTFMMLTRVAGQAVASPKTLETLEKRVVEQIAKECPGIEWVHNFAVLGPYDYVDIFRAPNQESAFKTAAIIRSFGHAQTEIWNATEWSRFKDLIRDLPGNA
jgi:uncharacterized protein with GYD domain